MGASEAEVVCFIEQVLKAMDRERLCLADRHDLPMGNYIQIHKLPVLLIGRSYSSHECRAHHIALRFWISGITLALVGISSETSDPAFEVASERARGDGSLIQEINCAAAIRRAATARDALDLLVEVVIDRQLLA